MNKDNARKDKGDNLGTKAQEDTDRKDNSSIGADVNRGIGVNNPSKRTDADKGVDKRIRIVNLGTRIDVDAAADNSNILAENLSIVADNPGIAADNLGTVVNNSGIETNTNTRANDSSITATHKFYATSFFALRYIFFLLAFSSKLVTASLLSSLPFLS